MVLLSSSSSSAQALQCLYGGSLDTLSLASSSNISTDYSPVSRSLRLEFTKEELRAPMAELATIVSRLRIVELEMSHHRPWRLGKEFFTRTPSLKNLTCKNEDGRNFDCIEISDSDLERMDTVDIGGSATTVTCRGVKRWIKRKIRDGNFGEKLFIQSPFIDESVEEGYDILLAGFRWSESVGSYFVQGQNGLRIHVHLTQLTLCVNII